MKKLVYFIFFAILSFELNAKTNPPFNNIIEYDNPKNYGDIIGKYNINGEDYIKVDQEEVVDLQESENIQLNRL